MGLPLIVVLGILIACRGKLGSSSAPEGSLSMAPVADGDLVTVRSEHGYLAPEPTVDDPVRAGVRTQTEPFSWIIRILGRPGLDDASRAHPVRFSLYLPGEGSRDCLLAGSPLRVGPDLGAAPLNRWVTVNPQLVFGKRTTVTSRTRQYDDFYLVDGDQDGVHLKRTASETDYWTFGRAP